MKKINKKLLLLFGAISSMAIHQLIEKEALKLVFKTISYPTLNDKLEGFKICHISDLHGKNFGVNNKRLIKMINDNPVDVIVMTGDMVEDDIDGGDDLVNLVQKLIHKAPILYVSGNHESSSRNKLKLTSLNRTVLYNKLRAKGVKILHGESFTLENLPITFSGIEDDFNHYESIKFKEDEFKVSNFINMPEHGNFNVCLVHRPNYFRSFANYGYDLMLSGHVHGGVIRLFKLGGLLSPDLKFFPEFDKGLYRYNKSYLNLTSGLFNSNPLPKIGNRPEVNIITLTKKEYIENINLVYDK